MMPWHFEPERRWFFAFWCDLRRPDGQWYPYPGISLGFFRIVKIGDGSWYRGWRFYFNND